MQTVSQHSLIRMTGDFKKTTREKLANVIIKHHTGSDGQWIQCECDRDWRGLYQWSYHLADEVLDAILDIALTMRESV